MKGLSLVFATLVLLTAEAKAARHPELVQPGKTQVSKLGDLLGKPYRVVREGPTREYYFYRLGNGSTMDTTVHVKSGVVEYMTYLCNDSIGVIEAKYGAEKKNEKVIRKTGNAYIGALSQVIYPEIGRGFIYEPKTKKVKACVAWEPGQNIDSIGTN